MRSNENADRRTPGRNVFTRRRTTVLSVLLVGALASLGMLQANPSVDVFSTRGPQDHEPEPPAKTDDEPLPVQVVQPEPQGLPHEIRQTGTIEPWETAELHSRVSGMLKTVAVEIGDEVQTGQLLAEIEAPELEKDVQRCQALLEQARQRVLQARASLKTIESSREAAEGALLQARADVERQKAERSFREKEYQRIARLVAGKSIEPKLADEKLHQLESARAGEEYARASRTVAEAELTRLDARIEQARADVTAAQADVRVAASELERAKLVAGYTRVVAPFAGIVVQRNFDRGDFVHSADEGADDPLLTVARTDRVRVVVRIPDAEVPNVRPGQPASVRVDALGGKTFEGSVSRIARHQDRRTRTMRAEIDLPNPAGRLNGGMYGKVTIRTPPARDRLAVPHNCLIGRAQGGRAQLYVLSDGRVQRQTVRVGRRTDPVLVEILDGLAADAQVLIGAADQPDVCEGCLAVRSP